MRRRRSSDLGLFQSRRTATLLSEFVRRRAQRFHVKHDVPAPGEAPDDNYSGRLVKNTASSSAAPRRIHALLD